MENLKYKVGDKVRIKSLNWYNENKNENGDIPCGEDVFIDSMAGFCGKVVTIENCYEHEGYTVKEDYGEYTFTDEMIESLVERNGKTYPYKIGDRVVLKGNNRCATITDLKYNSWGNLSYYIKIDNDKDISIDYPTDLLLPYDNMIEGLVEEECPQDFIENYCKSCGTQRCDRTKEYLDGCPYYNAYMCEKQKNNVKEETKFGTASNPIEIKSNANCLTQERVDEQLATKIDKELPSGNQNVWELPEGYIFKDERGNEIHALKIVLEKANTLKTQSNNMETETHKGYYTTEPETNSTGKKVAWFTFEDNDFADKVELDLSNRKLIQEDGKWFVVKKKNEYPKTYEECINELDTHKVVVAFAWEKEMKALQTLLVCRDAYWKIAGREMGLEKPWEPTNETVYCISRSESSYRGGKSNILEFPTPEMRDAFFNAFKDDIEKCKELL